MVLSLPSTFKQEGERPQGTNPWLWLLELVISRGDELLPPVILRTTSGQTQLQWPLSDPGSTTWYPFPFEFSPIEQNQEGDLPQLELTVDNTARFLSEYLHAGNGMEGNPATLFLVPTNALSLAYPNHQYQRWDLQVAGAVMNDEGVGIRLEMPNFLTTMSPMDRYVPSRCRWQYGSGQCGYVLNGFAAFLTCPKTIGACIERGADLVTRGLPAVLPGNYGGHPGVSVQRR
jgi:phage-related protein